MPTPLRSATCHPEKRAKTADGKCESCWRKEHRAKQRVLKTATGALDHAKEIAAETEQRARSLQELIAEAERELQEAIPEAAKALRLAAKIASLRGDSRPAEVILSQLPVPTADGKGSRRLLEPAPRQPAIAEPSGPQIMIGVRIEQPQPAPVSVPARNAPELPAVIEATAVVPVDGGSVATTVLVPTD